MSSPANPSANATQANDPLAMLSELADIKLDSTFGAVLLGTFLGLVLYGLGLHQAYRYARLYPEDAPLIKGLVSEPELLLAIRILRQNALDPSKVIAIVILETIHSVMNMHTCYYYLVTNFFNPIILPKRGVWSISFLPACASSIMIVSQIFFARRVYLIGAGYRYLVALAVLFLIGESAFSLAASIEANIVTGFDQFYGLTWLISACFAMAAAADFLLTGGLIVVLRRSRTGFKRTDNLIDILIIYAINTGMIIGFSNILSLTLAAAMPRNLIYVGVNIITAKLYANCFLAVLNSRKRLASRGMDIFDLNSVRAEALARVKERLEVPRADVLEQYNVPQVPDPEPPVIHVHVTTETVADGECVKSETGQDTEGIGLDSFSISV
ncbi:hypothetical protein ONZ51_g4586 [Trametes cubensis]|uniref:DUF6534 domain-containing protein n=1 Tax=Trametes cubensis TaxID=1111947 RepID=A0AAD7TY32_9APHY|nr:hypothetical protein ONZ51_g4586 [Trametes cubensis]